MSESVEESQGLPLEASASETSALAPVEAEPAAADAAAEEAAEQTAEDLNSSVASEPVSTERPASGGPLSLERIRQLRMSQQSQQRPPQRQPSPRQAPKQSQQGGGGKEGPRGPRQDSGQRSDQRSPRGDHQISAEAAPVGAVTGGAAGAPEETTQVADTVQGMPSPSASGPAISPTKPARSDRDAHKPRRNDRSGVIPTPEPLAFRSKIAVPSVRQPLSQDMELELNEALGLSDLDKLLVGDDMLQVGHELMEGQRVQATVMKAHGEHVFVSLGGPNEGVIPSLSFESLPEIGATLDVVVRGYLAQEGLYEITVSGSAVDVSDWSDLNEGEVIEALVTGANAGGLECKVGNIQGFIPASQAAEYRIETLADFVGQKLLCVVTEANPRRGNLVLSHRAVLEREKKEKREERLAKLEIGMSVEGTVRKILDFGAFVDIGGLDGLLHVSQLSWERVKHPSEVLEEGQKIQVRIDKIDEATGKIGLSYRSLQDHPWTNIDSRFPVGSIAHGTVTRIAEFGAFVRIATGVEGLVHVSELAHHRVHNVGNVVQEGQEVDVKVLSVDVDQQRISLSLKGAQAVPEPRVEESSTETSAVEEERPTPVLPKHRGPLKGGTGNSSSGEQFGLKW